MRSFQLCLALALFVLSVPALAAKVEKVDIQGLDEPMTNNVRGALSLVDAIGKDIPGRRLGYLLRTAERETRDALAPFGYDSPTITITDSRGARVERVANAARGDRLDVATGGVNPDKTLPAAKAVADAASSPAGAPVADASRSDAAVSTAANPDGSKSRMSPSDRATSDAESDADGDDNDADGDARAATSAQAATSTATAGRTGSRAPVTVTIRVDPGPPTRVRNADIAIIGEGGQDRYLKEDLGAFTPRKDEIFNHATYEASKTRITRRLAERGYFDSDFTTHRVEITRSANAADIDLVWTSGDRYDMGVTTFNQTPERIVRDDLLEKLVYWEPGQYYHQGRLDRLRKSLVALDYFSRIDIQPQPDKAVDKQVPIEVTLTPAKRSIYTAGLSYGTDSGAGVRLGVERRYLNDRGHKALAQIDFAQNRKTLTLQYRIPAFAWLDGWYTASVQATDEQSDYIDSRRVELVGSRSGQYNRNLNLVASLHLLRERWAYTAEDDDPQTPVLYRSATYLYPSIRGEYIDVDDRLFPKRGIGGAVTLRGGLEGVGSDASFGQIMTRASWFKGIGERNRLIVRGEIGHTFTDAVVALPPSLRFYAGGDRSIRGYEYREVGPRIPAGPNRKPFSLGAKNLLTVSGEFEHYFTDTIGGAAFVDSGDAFDGGSPDMRTGVGIGARYKSPVGPIKFDIARGLDDPDSAFTIGLSIGADF